jgi:hypothetical protein
MKILILLMILISCGKQLDPMAEDLQDDDGDQILNRDEPGFEKYVAQLPIMEDISGVIRLNAGKLIEIKFSNSEDLHDKALFLITRQKPNQNGYFLEYRTKLIFKGNPVIPELLSDQYNLHLSFHDILDSSLSFGMMKEGKLVYSKPLEK